MGPLMTAALADKTESLAYRSEPTMTEPMSNETAASLLESSSLPYVAKTRQALSLAIAALRADGANAIHGAYDVLLADHNRLQERFTALDAEKIEMVGLYRAAEAKLERTWSVVEILLDRVAEDEAR